MKRQALAQLAAAFCTLALSISPQAEESAPSGGADWEQRLDKAAGLQARGQAIQAEADALLEARRADCQNRFLVISCQKDAAAEHLESTKRARLLSNEGNAIERQVRKEKLNEQDMRRAAEAPQRAADMEQRQNATVVEREASSAEEAAIRQKKAREAEEGSLRRTREAERLRQKQEAHAAKLASKKAAAERRAAGSKGE